MVLPSTFIKVPWLPLGESEDIVIVQYPSLLTSFSNILLCLLISAKLPLQSYEPTMLAIKGLVKF